MKQVPWSTAAVIVAVVAGVVVLGSLGRDTAALVGLAGLILAGIGLLAGQTAAVKEQTNGNITKMLDMVHGMAQLLATMQPPAVIDGEVVTAQSAPAEEDENAP
jgi:hypothetical protein